MRLMDDKCIKDDLWELRHPDGRGVVSSIPYCGYSKDTLASLRRSGFQLYHSGKLIKGGGL